MEQEKIELNRAIEFYKQQELNERDALLKKNRAYGSDLLQQIDYNQQQRSFVSHMKNKINAI